MSRWTETCLRDGTRPWERGDPPGDRGDWEIEKERDGGTRVYR